MQLQSQCKKIIFALNKCCSKNLTSKENVLKIAMYDLDNGRICYLYGQELADVSILVSQSTAGPVVRM